MLDTQLLINEISLGNTLNQCVHAERRQDFSLMLAMLTQDAREFSEFMLPDSSPENKSTDDNSQLREYFSLPKAQALALSNIEQVSSYNQADLVATPNMVNLHFLNALAPKPLAFRDDAKHINHDVFTNMSVHCQQRYLRQKNTSELQPTKLSFNAKSWLKNVQESIVAATPNNVHSIA